MKAFKGYQIINHIVATTESFVVGYNPNAKHPYVTLRNSYLGEYSRPHYFDNEHDAAKDLRDRAGLI